MQPLGSVAIRSGGPRARVRQECPCVEGRGEWRTSSEISSEESPWPGACTSSTRSASTSGFAPIVCRNSRRMLSSPALSSTLGREGGTSTGANRE